MLESKLAAGSGGGEAGPLEATVAGEGPGTGAAIAKSLVGAPLPVSMAKPIAASVASRTARFLTGTAAM